jgi:peptide/nickel transport system substrate-binding protein
MASQHTMSRRNFLRSAGGGVVGIAGLGFLAACNQPQPTPPAAKPTAAAPAPTAATAAASTLATGPTAASSTAPAAAAKPGRNLIGKLEGPEVILDATKWPKKFGEAPMWADQVKASKLPPVEQRIPSEPLVVKPLREIGKYGGTWRRGFTGPADGENGNRIVSTDKILFWDYSGTKLTPCVAKDWKLTDDGKVTTISLRKGHKWSDGAPFTANDFMFWWDDIYGNKELVPTPHPEMSVNGKQGVMKKVDDLTIAFEFPDPYWLFPDILGGDTMMGGGQACGTNRGGGVMGTYSPAQYLKQFHPKYVSKDALDQKVKDAKVDNWVSLFKSKSIWSLNPEVPVLTPWRTTSPLNTPNWMMERNPYYYGIDSEGNQLPYIDKVQLTLCENTEVLNLRVLAGEYDLQERYTETAKLPLYLESAAKQNYTVRLDPGDFGAATEVHFNQSWEGDPETMKWIRSKDFRHALSLALDRDQFNEIFFLGLAVPSSTVPAEGSPECPGAQYIKLWSTYDPKQANDILDRIGLSKKDSEGYRLRADGQRLRMELQTVAASGTYTQQGEMFREHWKKVGIYTEVKEVERSLHMTRMAANEQQLVMWNNNGTERLYLFPRHALPVDPTEAMLGPLIAKWFASNGAQGKKPEDPQMLKVLDMFKAASGQKTEERTKTAQEIWKIIAEEVWSIGVCGQSAAVRVVSNRLGNIPERQVNGQHARTPGTSHPATWYFKS